MIFLIEVLYVYSSKIEFGLILGGSTDHWSSPVKEWDTFLHSDVYMTENSQAKADQNFPGML